MFICPIYRFITTLFSVYGLEHQEQERHKGLPTLASVGQLFDLGTGALYISKGQDHTPVQRTGHGDYCKQP